MGRLRSQNPGWIQPKLLVPQPNTRETAERDGDEEGLALRHFCFLVGLACELCVRFGAQLGCLNSESVRDRMLGFRW